MIVYASLRSSIAPIQKVGSPTRHAWRIIAFKTIWLAGLMAEWTTDSPGEFTPEPYGSIARATAKWLGAQS
jgi:hypothetical protein